MIMIGTRKGAFFLRSDESRNNWVLEGPHLLGSMVHHIVMDPRPNKENLMLMAARTGHLGPTVFRSTDLGKTWKEATKPPAFKKARDEEKGRVVKYTLWLTPGHKTERNTWYAGTSPHGLFRTNDDGDTWEGVSGFNEHPMRPKWGDDIEAATPDGPLLHSINIDPRNPNHIYLGLSTGGFFESTTKGTDWTPLNKGCVADFLPTPDPEYGHDPHCVYLHPLDPDRLYMQNHCGIYRLDRSKTDTWDRIGENMPKEIGDIGFPMTLHPRDPDTVWVFPMDGTDVWPRTSPAGKPAVYITRNGGSSWERQDRGLPPQGWFTVLRQAMTADQQDPAGIYFGTTNGELWASNNEGEEWSCLIQHLPKIFSLEVGEI
ncbi:MAG: glycosyl hydrolase [Candidatus Heimdallarchaeota archaeon]